MTPSFTVATGVVLDSRALGAVDVVAAAVGLGRVGASLLLAGTGAAPVLHVSKGPPIRPCTKTMSTSRGADADDAGAGADTDADSDADADVTVDVDAADNDDGGESKDGDGAGMVLLNAPPVITVLSYTGHSMSPY